MGPEEAAAQDRDGENGALTGEGGTRKSAATRTRRTASAGVNEGFALIARDSHEGTELPDYFLRRGEAMPGTYDRSGRLAPKEMPASNSTAQTSPPGSAMSPLELSEDSLHELTQGPPVEKGPGSAASASVDPPWLRRSEARAGNRRSLTAMDETVIRDLKKLERKIMNREMEQARAGGGVSGKSRHYVETGPDGGRYVTDGTTTPAMVHGGTPEQELARARAVRRAALAPSSPSAQDLSVASEARRIEVRAEQKVEETRVSLEARREFGSTASLENLDSLLAQEEAASARRREMREQEEQRGTRRAAARRSLNVAEVEDRTIDNPEVVTLKRQFAMEAYVDQL